MKKIQKQIKNFDHKRDWDGPDQVKDLLLNMSEEIGEMWNLIKWVDTKTQVKVIKQNKAEAENFIGDMIFLTLKIAHIYNLDSEKAIKDVLKEYERRFPIKICRGKHANLKAGGIDLKSKN